MFLSTHTHTQRMLWKTDHKFPCGQYNNQTFTDKTGSSRSPVAECLDQIDKWNNARNCSNYSHFPQFWVGLTDLFGWTSFVRKYFHRSRMSVCAEEVFVLLFCSSRTDTSGLRVHSGCACIVRNFQSPPQWDLWCMRSMSKPLFNSIAEKVVSLHFQWARARGSERGRKKRGRTSSFFVTL